MESVEVEIGGENQARENGIAHFTITSSGKEIHESSKYMVLWRFEDKVNMPEEGQEFSIILVENATTGYTWDYKVNRDALQLIDTKILKPGKGMLRAPSQEKWTFKAKQKGIYKLQFSYVRLWENDNPAIKTIEYSVEVK
ncbi:hypothetical protein GCM10008018_30560 [Paenibacillus marchantiophytorum]|uniref:GOLD domain-containing protein n=1 Tax=Paenibacillus marchantiophytorum TaxID=1619310 RepID=A0ABQ1ER57_9BACL|nr:protease inhibitor I42 family protein [Paenibacillus marchantiophytorum]GFZ82624.1 hypothetical protein GCM10008018_30560 [Paenibacillus marchantiophytorum]